MTERIFGSLTPTRDGLALGAGTIVVKRDAATLSFIDLLKAEGLLPKNATAILQKAYNPDEPRDAQGRWTGDGDAQSEEGTAKPEPDRRADIKDPSSDPQNPTEHIASNRTPEECWELCSDYALPSRDYGINFQRCVAQCKGESYWPEWAPYFPSKV